MRSNQHSNERAGQWDLSKLPGPDSPLHKPLVSLVKGDEKVGGCGCERVCVGVNNRVACFSREDV